MVSFASAEQLQQAASQLLACSEADACCCTCRLLKRVGAECNLEEEKKKKWNFSLLWKMGTKVCPFPEAVAIIFFKEFSRARGKIC